MKKTIKKISDSTNYHLNVYLEQDYDNVGLYTPTNGEIGHIDVLCNFVVKTNSEDTTVILRDSVDGDRYKFMKNLSYKVDWGDNIQNTYDANGDNHSHTYNVDGIYEITVTIETPWGRNRQVKKITIPSNIDITFDVTTTTPESLGYDYEMVEQYHNTSGVIICQYGVSRLNELKKYGVNGLQATITEVEGKSGIDGISQITTGLSTANMVYVYFIDGIKYMDDEETGYTTISVYPTLFTDGQNENFTHELLSMGTGPVVHQEVFHGITNDIEIQSDIFINRGKQAPFEFYYKMGEVSNMKELEQNGNKFFKIKDEDDFRN